MSFGAEVLKRLKVAFSGERVVLELLVTVVAAVLSHWHFSLLFCLSASAAEGFLYIGFGS